MNAGRLSDSQVDLTDQILEYLVQHPEAQDTVEGVTEWWLLEQRLSHALKDVEVALGRLASQGLLVASQSNDGRTHYRLNREMEPRIHAHLANVVSEHHSETKPKTHGAAPSNGG